MFHYQFSSAPLSKGNPMEVIYQISDASIRIKRRMAPKIGKWKPDPTKDTVSGTMGDETNDAESAERARQFRSQMRSNM